MGQRVVFSPSESLLLAAVENHFLRLSDARLFLSSLCSAALIVQHVPFKNTRTHHLLLPQSAEPRLLSLPHSGAS